MRVITTVEELDALPWMTTVASIHSVLNEPPLVLVFQRGTYGDHGPGWYHPGVQGAIDSHALFRFLMVNELPFRLHVLWEQTAAEVAP